MFGISFHHDLGAQIEGDNEVLAIRCYRCACVVKLWNRDHPFKFVNCVKIQTTPNFVRELDRKKKEYKYTFECLPKLEKSNMIAMALDEHYKTWKNVDDGFYCCYLGVCDVEDWQELKPDY